MKTMNIPKKGILVAAMATVCMTASASKRAHFRHVPKLGVETVVVVKEKAPVKHKHHHKHAKQVVKKVIVVKK